MFQLERKDLEKDVANSRPSSGAQRQPLPPGSVITASGFESSGGYPTAGPTRRKGRLSPSRYNRSHSPTEDSQRFDDNMSIYSVNGSLMNRCSRYTSDRTNPGKSRSTVGLNSCFGLDSPSYSVRGSLPQSRRPEDKHSGPGPGAYNSSSVQSFKPSSPQARGGTFGTSSRNTADNFILTGLCPGRSIETNKPQRAKVKGGQWSKSERWRNHPLDGRNPSFREGLSPRPVPGPADYQPKQGCLSTFK